MRRIALPYGKRLTVTITVPSEIVMSDYLRFIKDGGKIVTEKVQCTIVKD